MRRPLTSLHHVALREFSAPPTHAVDSLDTLRKYIGLQDEPQQVVAVDPMTTASYWKARGDEDKVAFAKGTFLRFEAVLSALDIPINTAEARQRDELLSVLAAHRQGAS